MLLNPGEKMEKEEVSQTRNKQGVILKKL